jgi:sucrose-6-phosphate hydrolase SacC (GH32 family)
MDFSETLPEVFELALRLQLGQGPVLARWRLSNSAGEYLDFILDSGRAELQLDRRHSGWDQQGFGRIATAPLPPAKRQLELRILVDACSAEVFVDQGYSCLTALCFPSRAFRQLGFSLEAGALQSCCCVGYGLTGNTQGFAAPDYVAGDDKTLA